jgi:hypothetical protein
MEARVVAARAFRWQRVDRPALYVLDSQPDPFAAVAESDEETAPLPPLVVRADTLAATVASLSAALVPALRDPADGDSSAPVLFAMASAHPALPALVLACLRAAVPIAAAEPHILGSDLLAQCAVLRPRAVVVLDSMLPDMVACLRSPALCRVDRSLDSTPSDSLLPLPSVGGSLGAATADVLLSPLASASASIIGRFCSPGAAAQPLAARALLGGRCSAVVSVGTVLAASLRQAVLGMGLALLHVTPATAAGGVFAACVTPASHTHVCAQGTVLSPFTCTARIVATPSGSTLPSCVSVRVALHGPVPSRARPVRSEQGVRGGESSIDHF